MGELADFIYYTALSAFTVACLSVGGTLVYIVFWAVVPALRGDCPGSRNGPLVFADFEGDAAVWRVRCTHCCAGKTLRLGVDVERYRFPRHAQRGLDGQVQDVLPTPETSSTPPH